MSLRDALADPERRNLVIDDCCQLVDDEVARKKGFTAVVIKTAYKAVKGIKPGFIRQVVSSLLDEWVAALDPIWQQGVSAGGPPADYLVAHRPEVAEALLSVTDGKADRSKSGLIRSTYKKLRPSAKEHVEEAVPGLAAILAKRV
jgi:hypothetical protein